MHIDLVSNVTLTQREIERRKIHTISMTNTPSVFLHSHKMFETSKYVRVALGLHPQLAEARKAEVSMFSSLLPYTRYVGEIGLDYGRNSVASVASQHQVFERILSHVGESGDKVISVHSRRAERDVVAMIGLDFPGKVIMHWYSGSIDCMRRALVNGFYFSVNPSMLRSDNGLRILRELPVERILTESDTPFSKDCHAHSYPNDYQSSVAKIAVAKGYSVEEFSDQVRTNFLRLLS